MHTFIFSATVIVLGIIVAVACSHADGYPHIYFQYSLETLPDNYNHGEAGEGSVSAILYDLTDPVNSNDEDFISLSDSFLWTLITVNHCTKLSDLVSALYGSSSLTVQQKLSLGTTLAQYKVAPRLDSYIDLTMLGNNTPVFYWDGQGGSSLYPNNVFRLAVYDSSFNQVFITGYLTTTSYQFSITDWLIVKSYGPVSYVCIEAVQTNSPVTGPYYSNVVTVNNPYYSK